MNRKNKYLLEVEDLKMHFPIFGGIWRRAKGVVYAVDGVSFTIKPGETLGLVGESGCGKTTVGRSILKLYKPTSGRVVFDGLDLADLKGKRMRNVRQDLQIIFQDPFESLNQRHTLGYIIEEPLLIHGRGNRIMRREIAKELLKRVGLQENAYDRFPHEFSGGQRQRIGIARAIALNPKLVVCDEPVSALDVSIQSQILNLLLDLQGEMGLAFLFIAHDLSVVRHMSDNIAVMYLGKIVEHCPADALYETPLHPYTRALISAIPMPRPMGHDRQRQILSGDVPSPINPPLGCRFNTRCPIAEDLCRQEEPILLDFNKGNGEPHLVACHLADKIKM